jgi:hypothetical protein
MASAGITRPYRDRAVDGIAHTDTARTTAHAIFPEGSRSDRRGDDHIAAATRRQPGTPSAGDA